MAVSVVIPAYNAADHISDAVESALGQSWEDREVIVVNDGSPDTAAMDRALEPFAGRITYIRRPNGGPSAARNTGIQAATGEYVAFLDADDSWHPDFLESQLGFLAEHKDVDMVYADAWYVGDRALAGVTFMDRDPSEGSVSFESLIAHRCTVITSGVVLRRSRLPMPEPFDESMRHAEDLDLWLRLARAGCRIAYQRRVLLSRRVRTNSLSADAIRLQEGVLRVISRFADQDLTSSERDAVKRALASVEASLAREYAKRHFEHGEYEFAIDALGRANRYYRSPKLATIGLALRVTPRLLWRAYRARERCSSLLARTPLRSF